MDKYEVIKAYQEGDDAITCYCGWRFQPYMQDDAIFLRCPQCKYIQKHIPDRVLTTPKPQ